MTRPSPDFSDSDRQRFSSLKEDLRKELPRTAPESVVIYQCARRFVEIRDRRYHQIDGAEQCDDWIDRTFGVGPHQAAKYFRVGDRLTAEEVQGKRQGLEAMDQAALALPALRPALWTLAESRRLSAGALAAGRLAAEPYARKNQMLRAHKVLASRALQQARKEEQERLERRARSKLTPCQRIEEGLEREEARLDKLLDDEVPLRPEEIARLRRRLARLAELDQRLAERTFETSENPKKEESQEDGEKFAEPVEQEEEAAAAPEEADQEEMVVEGPMAEYVPLIRAVRGALTQEEQIDLGESLFRIVHGEWPSGVLRDLRRIYRTCKEAGQAPPRAVFDRWLEGLLQPDPLERRLFALRFAMAARLPGLELKLQMLKLHPVPEAVKAEAQAVAS